MSGPARGREGQGGPGGGSQEAPGGSRGQDPGGETQGRSGRGGGQLWKEPWANNGLIKERVRVGRSWAETQPGNLLSPTQANGPIVLCGGEPRHGPGNAGLLPGGTPRWSQPLRPAPEGCFCNPRRGCRPQQGYLVVASHGQCRVWVPPRGPLKRGSCLPPAHFWETKALERWV